MCDECPQGFYNDLNAPVTGCDALFNPVSSHEFAQAAFVLYPQPADELLHLEGLTGNEEYLLVTNLAGMEVLRLEPAAQVDISALANGVYFLSAGGKEFSALRKRFMVLR
jgi:hypothetical protein